ncbi:NAD-dependent epimerase/dehydratase family protein [Candidatus Saccharibacteria bacterium]|nr:NAD-dependent epimerase/dehydratase family protein [Candidatus Saccharibacteria bacterium]
MKKVLVTGGAGFIGTNLIKKLLADGNEVYSVDNFTIGTPEHAALFKDNNNYHFIELNIDNTEEFLMKFKDVNFDMVYHLAANSDIQKGGQDPRVDYRDTFSTTRSVLELMRQNDIKKLFFASTSAVYGDMSGELITENIGNLKPISYYGGAKFASEGYISAYTFMNDLSVVVFRFPNVIGPCLTHGVIHDFVKKLKSDPNKLEILGDGHQTKPYIYVDDLVDVIVKMTENIPKGMGIYNIGVDSATSVTKIADIVCDVLGYKGVTYKYTGGNVGWKGDVPKFQYNLDKIHKTGWRAKYSSDEAVRKTCEWVKEQVL